MADGNFSEHLDALFKLYQVATDPSIRKDLASAHSKISAQHQKNIDADVKQTSKEYQNATQALRISVQRIRDAHDDVASVAEGITQLAQVLDFLTKAASKLG